MIKRAIITGITGQDGAYLARLLLNKGYIVYGTFRRANPENFWRLRYLNIYEHPALHLMEFDILDQSRAIRLIDEIRPHEIYNLAAQSYVGQSFEQPLMTTYCNGLGAPHLLEAIRIIDRDIKFYQASTSEMLGATKQVPQSETTPFHPRSPYGIAKLYAHWMTINYYESYGIFATSGILFNHESPLRGHEFVTRKITDGVGRILAGELSHIELGNLDAQRDWGYAPEYMDGIWRMLQTKEPETFVLATGRTASVRDFLRMAFRYAGIELSFSGQAETEVVKDIATGKIIARVNPAYYRPAEVDMLKGDASKAQDKLGWKSHTTLEKLCSLMMEAEMTRLHLKINDGKENSISRRIT